MNRQALRAKLRANVNAAEARLRALHAMRDWLGMQAALAEYWTAADEWRAA